MTGANALALSTDPTPTENSELLIFHPMEELKKLIKPVDEELARKTNDEINSELIEASNRNRKEESDTFAEVQSLRIEGYVLD